MSGPSEIPAPVDQHSPVLAHIKPTAPLSTATAPGGSVSAYPSPPDTSPAYFAARERIRRQLDEIQANILAERLKAKSLAPVAPLIDTPLIPIVPQQPSPPATVSSIETKPREHDTTTPPSPELPQTKNPRECPCGQLFSRPEHVLRHRARNICPAGFDRPGEPKRKTTGGTVSKAKLSNDDTDTSTELSHATKLTPSAPMSSPTRRAATGSRVTTQPDPSRQAKSSSSPRYRCECGRGFGHVGNYDRHRKSGKCQNRNEATEPKVAPVRVVGRSETLCECGKWYTHSHSLLRHIKQNVCDYGDPKATLATLSPTSSTSTPTGSSVSPDRHTPADSQPGEKRSRRPDDSVDEKVSKKVHTVSNALLPPAHKADRPMAKKLLAEDAGSEGETVISTGTKSSRTQSVA